MAITPTPTPAKPAPQPSPPADPQAAKAEARLAAPPAFTPKPAIDPRAETAPAGVYADGMPVADEQRARSAWIEAHGEARYMDEIDQRSAEERVNQQVPGVTPPTKRG